MRPDAPTTPAPVASAGPARPVRAVGLALLGFLWLADARSAAADEDAGLSTADLAPYRAALAGTPGGPAVAVTFRDLWDHPERYQGRRIRVEGRAVRRFRQGATGTFPPLVETWAVSPAGDPFCLVFPDSGPVAVGPDPAPGASVRFEGVFLRRLRYQGGDAARLAPWIVGHRPPVVTAPAPPVAKAGVPGSRGSLSRVEWTIGLLAAGFVALALARQHARGPSRRPQGRDRDRDPPPEFLDDV